MSTEKWLISLDLWQFTAVAPTQNESCDITVKKKALTHEFRLYVAVDAKQSLDLVFAALPFTLEVIVLA